MEECRFCSGKVIHNDRRFEDGFSTIKTMLMNWFGENDDEDETLVNGIQLRNGNLLAFESSAGEYESLGVEIKYCPLCGKELKEEETK